VYDVKKDLDHIWNRPFELGEADRVAVSLFQREFFNIPLRHPENMGHPYWVNLIHFAGNVSLLAYQESNLFVRDTARRLLPKLKELANLPRDPPARRYHALKLVKLLGCQITFRDHDDKEADRVLEGTTPQ
jgi:hypothetical protein